MKTSSFAEIIRLQFDSLMKLVIRRKHISHYRELAKRSKHEKPFCDLSDNRYLFHNYRYFISLKFFANRTIKEPPRDTSHKEVSLPAVSLFAMTVGYDEFVGK